MLFLICAREVYVVRAELDELLLSRVKIPAMRQGKKSSR